MCQSQSPNSFYHPHSPWYLYVCSLPLCFSFCLVNKIVATSFLRSHIYASLSGWWVSLSWGCSKAVRQSCVIWRLDIGWGIHCQDGSLTWLLKETKFFAGCWQKSSDLPVTWASPQHCMSILTTEQLASPRGWKSKKQGSQGSSWGLATTGGKHFETLHFW